jgi:protoheme IX farnesyltransferase
MKFEFKKYLKLSKSGIVTLVVISVLGGFFIGQPFERDLNWTVLAVTFFGVLFLSSGAAALNQIQEIEIDRRMNRTAKRPLPSGEMSIGEAAFFVGLMVCGGLAFLASLDLAIFWMGMFALFSYNGLYTLWWKKHWAYAAIPGAIPGALPIWMGHAAATGSVWTSGGIYLFAFLVFWQMPHFWSLALKYEKDYSDGGIPTLPVLFGQKHTLFHIRIWTLGYIALTLLAPLFLKVGILYMVLCLLIGFKTWIEASRYLNHKSATQENPNWIRFFLWINFSLILYLLAAVLDLWLVYFQKFWI